MDTYTWSTTPFSWKLAEAFSRELGLPLVLGVVLARRGFSSVADVRTFLAVDPVVPDPFLFADMEPAVGLLADAAARGRRVVVHGDYDVDGISATALMVEGLRRFGLEPEPYLPSRFVEGYGLSRRAVEEIASGGDALLVTVDCGVNYPEEVALAHELGLDVVVTDHHRPGDILPDAPLVHSARGTYPGDHLCGVGLALKTLHALHVALDGASRDMLPEPLLEELDLVALGTVADLVPLRGENRYYVHEGLVRVSQGSRIGLRALARIAGVTGVVDSHVVGFRLAPRLNAAGRLRDPRAPLRLLLTEDPAEAEELAAELDELNRRRQEVEAEMLAEAVAQVEALSQLPSALVLSGEGWHEGVMGIVASRIVERYRRPAVLLAVEDGRAKGSGRSISAYDLMEGLRHAASLLTVYGGHAQAAGLTLPAQNVPAFRETFTAHASASLSKADLRPRYSPDAIVRGDELNLDTVDALECLAPFGMGNPRVQLLALDARLERPGLTRSGEHLRCQLVVDQVRTRGIGFGLGDTLPSLAEEEFCAHAGFRLEGSEWQGFSRPEVRLHSLYRARNNGEGALGCTATCPYLDPLDVSPPCPRCSEPHAQPGSLLPVHGRDLRDRESSLSAVAQVLSSGEPAAVLGASITRSVRALAAGLPLSQLGVTGVECVGRLCWRTHMPELREGALVFLDYGAAQRRRALLTGRRHIIVADPPYQPAHTAMLAELHDGGATLHLCYGPEDREATVEALRFYLHPRVWMVALYRVWRDGFTGAEAFAEAARRVWEAEGELPTIEDLSRAADILAELAIGPGNAEAATMKAEESAAYVAAVRTYAEAVDLCRSL